MVQISAGASFPLRMDDLDVGNLFDGEILTATSTTMLLDIGYGFRERFTGYGVQYDGFGRPAAGTITGLTETYNGSVTYAITGMNIGAVQFYNWAATSDTDGAFFTILAGDDQFFGSDFDDLMAGFGGSDMITGGAGNDSLGGGEGHDNLFGGSGSDYVLGEAGNDHLYGQSANGGPDGSDTLVGGDGADYLQGNAGSDTLDGGNGSDRLNGGADADFVYGGAGNDSANGNLGSDTIDGGSGNDSLRGGQGDDSLIGGTGDDTLMGDLGNDTLVAGQGLDTITGGGGNDVFRFAPGDALVSVGALDVVTDFQAGVDKLALGLSATSVLTASASSLEGARAIAQSLFDGHAGANEVAAVQVGGETWILWDSSGGGIVSSAVRLMGVEHLAIGLSDFI